jgi:hypothetical protein
MARKPTTPINMLSLLKSSSGTLAHIQEKTNSLTILAGIVRQICPDLPEDAFKIANFHENILIVEVKSPIWGQRLQFERNNITKKLVQDTQGQFQSIQIKINPHAHTSHLKFNQVENLKQSKEVASMKATANQHTAQQSQEKQLASKTAKALLSIADKAPEGLKKKLEKLALVAGKHKY